MATMTIESYTAATNIDAVNDLLLEYQNSSGVYKSINRNTFLGLASAPLGLTDSQAVSNKTIGITNTIVALDSTFTIQDNGDNTKQVQFQLSGLTTATTRTFTMPDISSTIATIGGSQTFTGVNSFTGSSWTGGTISNTSISADTITGFTSSTSGNIYGIAVTSGVVTGAATVGSAALATNAVQANQIANNAITLGYAQITANSTTTSTSYAVGTTQLGAAVTIPAGGRRVKVSVYTAALGSSAATVPTMALFSGASVGTLTTQLTTFFGSASSSINTGACMVWSGTPSAGSIAYTVAILNSGGTTTITAGATFPAFILVETI